MKQITLKNRGFMCAVPGCNNPGQKCTIDVDNSAEADVYLCEKHFAEARAYGQ